MACGCGEKRRIYFEEDEPLVPGLEQFPQHERLTRRQDFLRIYQIGEKRVGGAFIMYVVRQTGHGRKLGCAVSKKVGGAVVRNRVKRYIREVYRKHRDHMAENAQIVMVARPISATLDYHMCETEIRDLFRQGDLLHE
jgi:ribonuclease P protein component